MSVLYFQLLLLLLFTALLPNDPNFIVGRNITMTCCRSSATSFTVDDIRFELELRGSSRSVEKRIPRTFVHILDDKCVRLDLSPVRKEHDAATIFCLCDSCHLQADSQRIRVGCKCHFDVVTCGIVFYFCFYFDIPLSLRSG
jgi:hypothetical protein